MEQDIFSKLYSETFRKVYAYTLKLSGDHYLSEEIVQEAFFRVYFSGRYNCRDNAVALLCSVARNLFIDEMRRNKRFSEFPEEIPDEKSIETDIEIKDLAASIRLKMKELKTSQRLVMEMRILKGLSFRIIGANFGRSENWARTTFHRSKEHLRKLIDMQQERRHE